MKGDFVNRKNDMMNRIWVWTCVAAACLAAATRPAYCQEVGHYLQGVAGVDAGTPPPPGFNLTYLPYISFVQSIKNSQGQTIVNVDNYRLGIHNVVVGLTFPRKILGGHFGISTTVPVTNQRNQTDAVGPNRAGGIGLSDIVVTPALLGWETKRADALVSYSFYAPTGGYYPDRILNFGLGFWEHQIQVGATVYFDAEKTLSAALLTTWGIPMSKSGRDITPGAMFTGEYGVGKKLLGQKLRVGVAGYIYHKLTPDSGTLTDSDERGLYDKAMGLGPDVAYTFPVKKLGAYCSLFARYQPQFDVALRTQGPVLVAGFTILNPFRAK